MVLMTGGALLKTVVAALGVILKKEEQNESAFLICSTAAFARTTSRSVQYPSISI
jgi:hypothetical protein